MFEQFGWPVSISWCDRCGGLSKSIGVPLLIAAAAMLTPWLPASAQQLTPTYVLSTITGNGNQTVDSGDGGPASAASVAKVYSVARDKSGNLYLANNEHVVRKITPDGTITTIAGTHGQPGYAGDGGPSTAALLNNPYGLAIDRDGNLLIADTSNYIVRKIDLSTGIITTIAGIPSKAGFSGDGGPATSAMIHNVFTVAVDGTGNIYLGDAANHRVRKIDASGTITTFAGNGTLGNTGDGGPAAQAELNNPWGIWADAAGNVYIGDNTANLVRMVDGSGMMHTLAGTGTSGYSGDGGPATSAKINGEHNPVSDGHGNVYFPDENNHIIRWVSPDGTIRTAAGTPQKGGFLGDGGAATLGKLYYPYGLDIDSSNNLYVADPSNGRVRLLSLNTILPATAVGSSATQNLFVQSFVAATPVAGGITPAAPAEFTLGALSGCTLGAQLAASTPCTVPITFQPSAPGLQSAQLSFSDASGTVSVIGLTGTGLAPQANFSLAEITTIAGNGTAAFAGDGGSAAKAQVSAPRGGVIDSAGNIYFADSGNNTIRRIDGASGAISTVVGTGVAGYTGDGGAATKAELNAPAKVALGAAGDLYIADTGNNVIRYVDAATGLISTIAGTGVAGYAGDGLAATAAQLNQPQGLAVDLGGHVYVADTANNAIRYFGKGGSMSTFTGNGTAGYTGDGGNRNSAELRAPTAVALGPAGDGGVVYIADTGNDVIRVVSPMNKISTIAGQQGTASNSGDGGAATLATLASPSDLALDAAGDLYIAAGGKVRLVNALGIIGTIAGTGAAGNYSGEGGPATSAVLPAPVSNLMLDSSANIVLADTAANRMLRIDSATAMVLNLGVVAAGKTGSPTTFSVLNTGNSALNLTGVAVTSGYTLNTSDPASCTSATSLAAGHACTISLILSPATSADGAVSGTLTITDNALNGAGATQTFLLQGATRPISFTTTAVSASTASPVYGSPVTFSATVNNSNSPSGTVTFAVNGASIGSATVSKGVAALTVSNLPAGSTKINASYSGDLNNSSSAGSVTVNVQPAVLTITANNVTMPAGTTPPALTYTSTGFVNGDTSSTAITGSPTEVSAASPSSPQGATYPITITQGTLAAANYTFAFQNGTITIGPPPAPDFLFSVTPTVVSITAGQPYTATVTLIPLYNYRGTAKISCSSAPAGLGCTGATLTGGGGLLTGNAQGAPVWAQITISGSGKITSAAANNMPAVQRLTLAMGMPLCFAGMLLFRRKNRRMLESLFGLMLLAIVTAGVVACTAMGVSSSAKKGTYQIVVTATDTSTKSLTHTATLNLTLR